MPDPVANTAAKPITQCAKPVTVAESSTCTIAGAFSIASAFSIAAPQPKPIAIAGQPSASRPVGDVELDLQ